MNLKQPDSNKVILKCRLLLFVGVVFNPLWK